MLEHLHYSATKNMTINNTITRMTTQGRFNDLTISMATDVFPEPELPAMPMMLRSAHGGEYCLAVADEYIGGMDSMMITIPVPSNEDSVV